MEGTSFTLEICFCLKEDGRFQKLIFLKEQRENEGQYVALLPGPRQLFLGLSP